MQAMHGKERAQAATMHTPDKKPWREKKRGDEETKRDRDVSGR